MSSKEVVVMPPLEICMACLFSILWLCF
jgi:hypothetical protein